MTRWISERLGTCAFNELRANDVAIVDVRHLIDRRGNPKEAVVECIEQGVRAWEAGRTVVVACDLGMSRSNAIAAAILSHTGAVPFDTALSTVVEVTGEKEINVDFLETVRVALGVTRGQPSTRAVLVTGGSGLIGRNLVARLAKGHDVYAPRHQELELVKGSVELVEFCAANAVTDLVHLAYPRQYTTNEAIGIGLIMLRNVLDACRTLGLRLVFVSSAVIYAGYRSVSFCAGETTPPRSKGNYSDAKCLEEALVGAYARRGDLEVTTCRFSPVYGEGADRPRLIRTFAGRIIRGEVITTHIFRNGRPALDLLHVDDAAEALSLAVTAKGSDVFNFGTGKLTTTLDIARLIGSVFDREFEHQELKIDDDIGNIAMNAAKAREQLGWSPKVDIESGLRAMLARN